MDDDAYLAMMAELRRSAEVQERLTEEVRRVVDALIGALGDREVLNEGQLRMLARLRAVRQPPAVPIELAEDENKDVIEGADIDCAARLHLCQARCCGFTVKLSRQCVEEHKLAFQIDKPYRLRREQDGYCTYLDRDRGGCRTYATRPATCRRYDCRGDRRVWVDFEQMIPAPLPERLVNIRLRGRED